MTSTAAGVPAATGTPALGNHPRLETRRNFHVQNSYFTVRSNPSN